MSMNYYAEWVEIYIFAALSGDATSSCRTMRISFDSSRIFCDRATGRSLVLVSERKPIAQKEAASIRAPLLCLVMRKIKSSSRKKLLSHRLILARGQDLFELVRALRCEELAFLRRDPLGDRLAVDYFEGQFKELRDLTGDCTRRSHSTCRRSSPQRHPGRHPLKRS